ncbi:Rpn family recombination-promoting nuclease/putative transposase (plasmid) [Pedobacter sp. BS3]|uniref:Rpn family recombination-promoting nuclease/putative transposase n=1 Tax=Pedobacter sp. BS3 TaxID=2567937 RepID=UPI0011EFEA5A|nr:Rpn family recombination-promoting nuclease/putative transposase [Pedobacter sp. BS3]TZF86383.1 Rpn family recombination-promoting nuclease/putative transposase [Pedobacter sp. BS3]
MTKYIDPLTDFSFKRLFGTEPNKDILISFINSIFRGRKTVIDLVYNKNEYTGDTENVGSVIFDLTCTGDDGSQFLIEVQRTDQSNLKKRMLYYSSKLIADQAPKGRRSEWGYQISEVYVIALLDGFTLTDGKRDRYLHDVCLCNRETGEVFYEELGFFYLELVNFVKDEAELVSDLDKWLYVLTNMSKLDKLPVYLRKPIFEKLFDIAEYSKLNKEERTMYDVSLKRRWDEYSVKETIRQKIEEGRERGRAEGRAEGRVEGRVEGREQGRTEGIEKGKAEIVRNLILSNRFTDEEIAAFASVEIDFVRKIHELEKEK